MSEKRKYSAHDISDLMVKHEKPDRRKKTSGDEYNEELEMQNMSLD